MGNRITSKQKSILQKTNNQMYWKDFEAVITSNNLIRLLIKKYWKLKILLSDTNNKI
jgi:hypothetical protein